MWLISLPPFVILVSYGVSPSSKAFLWPLEPSQSSIPSQNHPTVFCFLSFPFLGLICNPNCSFRLVLIDCLYSVSRIWSLWEKVLTASTGSWAVPGTEEMLNKSLLNKLMAVPKHFVSQNTWLSFPSVYQLGTPRSVPIYEGVPCVCSSGAPTPFSLRGSPILCSDEAEGYFCKFSWSHLPCLHGNPQQVCLILIPWRLWPSTPWVSVTFLMSSRGIVSAKSEIPGNRHHRVIGMPSSSGSSALGTSGNQGHLVVSQVYKSGGRGRGIKWEYQDPTQGRNALESRFGGNPCCK